MNELIKPAPFSRQEIIKRATDLFRSYVDCVGFERAMLGINFDVIYKRIIYPEYGIDLIEDQDLSVDEDGEKVLGYFQPEFNRVFIDPSLKDDPRRVFTCWHEVGGHAILQGDWLRQEMNRIGMIHGIETTDAMMSHDVEDILEKQANLFAAHAAAPTPIVDYRIEQTFGLTQAYRYTGPNNYCFAIPSGTRYREAENFEQLCNHIAYYIQRWFGGLSVEALSYRVAESKWVVDTTQHNNTNPLSKFGLKRSSRKAKQQKTKNSSISLCEKLLAVR